MVKPLQHLLQARKQSFVYNDQAFHLGVCSIAAPILDASGQAVAGINATAMIYTFTDEIVEEKEILAVLAAAQELLQCMGYRRR